MPDMPAISEHDLEQLELYVDGELTTTEEDALRARMAAEPILAEMMKAVRADREIRLAVWKSCEPSEPAVQRLIAHVDAAVDRNTVWSYRLRTLRRASAVAACVVFGILVGRVGNQGAMMPGSPDRNGVSGQTMVSNPSIVEYPIFGHNGRPVATQRFQSPREAQEFMEELNRFRAQEQIRNGGGQILFPTERF
jgi:anti-sigma factor RsiW